MTELLFDQLKKARSPWWVFVLAFGVSIVVALMRAKTAALKSQKAVVEYQREKSVAAAAVADGDAKLVRLYARIRAADLRISTLDEALKEIDANAVDAKKRITAAKSFRDLQS